MATPVILCVLVAVLALIGGFTAGKDRYAAMTEEAFEAEAKRSSLLGAAVMGLQKVFEPKRVQYIMQRDKRVEGDSAEAGVRPPHEPPVR